MKILIIILLSLISATSYGYGCERNESELMHCSFREKMSRDISVFLYSISFCLDEKTQKIRSTFSRGKNNEFQVIFDEKNKLKRAVDHELNIDYYGFSRGVYDYTVDVMNSRESNGYSMVLTIKKNGKAIQSNDCLDSKYRSDTINSIYIKDVPFNRELPFP